MMTGFSYLGELSLFRIRMFSICQVCKPCREFDMISKSSRYLHTYVYIKKYKKYTTLFFYLISTFFFFLDLSRCSN